MCKKKYIVEESRKCTFCAGEGFLYNSLWQKFEKIQKDLNEQSKEDFWQQYGYSWYSGSLPPAESRCSYCQGEGKEFSRTVLTKAEMFEAILIEMGITEDQLTNLTN